MWLISNFNIPRSYAFPEIIGTSVCMLYETNETDVRLVHRNVIFILLFCSLPFAITNMEVMISVVLLVQDH